MKVVETHHGVCAVCGDPWPCDSTKRANRAYWYAYNRERACQRCRALVGSGQMAITVSVAVDHAVDVPSIGIQERMLYYHGRLGACREAAERRIADLRKRGVEIAVEDNREQWYPKCPCGSGEEWAKCCRSGKGRTVSA